MDEESRKLTFDAGREVGHAQAIVAAYEVLREYSDNHDEYLAILDVIKAIQALS